VRVGHTDLGFEGAGLGLVRAGHTSLGFERAGLGLVRAGLGLEGLVLMLALLDSRLIVVDMKEPCVVGELSEDDVTLVSGQ